MALIPISVRIETVDNTIAWGEVTGRNNAYSEIVDVDRTHYGRPFPGMLVTSYDGQLRQMRARGYDRPGLGIVLGVADHPRPQGQTKYRCTVLWNWA